MIKYILGIIILLGAVGLYLKLGNVDNRVAITATSTPTSTGQIACTAEAKQCSDGSYVSRQGRKCEFQACPAIADKISNELSINIKEGQIISLPLTIKGTATNIFEGQWGNVTLYDHYANILATARVLVACDYGQPCAFSLILNASPSTKNGFLVFSRENPSGLAQNGKSYKINIVFAGQTANKPTCPQLMPPGPNFCPNGKVISGGKDANGCALPPKCESNVVY